MFHILLFCICRKMHFSLFSFENYFDELVQVFDGLFGDWTLEQKAWLSSKVEEYWQMEVFRTYYLDSGYAPFKTVLFKRLLDEQRCGLPDESAYAQKGRLTIDDADGALCATLSFDRGGDGG